MNAKVSQLKFYSVGIVAANKKPSSFEIEVTPMEDVPMLSGEVTDNIEEVKAQGKSANNENYNVNLKTTASIKAKWLSLTDTNRMTAPDVRRGEKVIIYQFSDTDEYYWTTLQQDAKLRKLETVIYSYSNQRDENTKHDSDSSYWIEISTQGKYIHLHTAKNDKEPFAYDIQINTKKGCIIIQDDDDNYIFLDSKERQIKLHNRDDSFIDIDKKKIHINAVDEVKVTTKNFIVEASMNIRMQTTKYSLSTSSYATASSNWVTQASSYSVVVPTAQFSSNVSVGGNVNAGGSVSASHIHGNSYSGGHHS